MNLEKQIFIAVWALLLTGGVIYLIKAFAFLKRKKEKEYNVSESIYLTSVILSAASVLKSSLLMIFQSYDITYKLSHEKLYYEIIKTSSAISITGIVLLALNVLIARFISSIFFPKRNELLEFDNNNIPYAIIRSAILVIVVLLFSLSSEGLMGYFVPNDIPFFRG